VNQETIELNDEVLSAYLDGALDTHTLERVSRALDNDPGARVRLGRMRTADDRLRDAFALRPVAHDDPIAAHIQTGVPLPALQSRTRRHRVTWWSAAAAGVFGVALGFFAASFNRETSVPLAQQSATLNPVIVTALQSVASGGRFERYGQAASVLLSFKADDGRYCRVFEWRTTGFGAEGMACRNGQVSDGQAEKQWQLIAWDATADASDSTFQTAGASELIDTAMDRLGGNGVLNANQERTLIESDWRTQR
jgi:hypothetical protein